MAMIDDVVAAIQAGQPVPQDNRRWIVIEATPNGTQLHRHNLNWAEVHTLLTEWGTRSHLQLHEEQNARLTAANAPAPAPSPQGASQRASNNLFE